MNLDKNNIKKILLIIVFTVALFAALDNLKEILYYIGLFLTILIPFFIGGVIAFVLNIPMKAIENIIFKNNKIFKKGVSKSVSRAISLVLSIFFVVIIFSAVINIVVPQLVTTISSIGTTIYSFLPKVKEFCKNIIAAEDINYYFDKIMNINWNTIFNYVGNFVKSGGSMINSTIGVVSSIFSTTVNIIIGIIFALYILLQKEKLSQQALKILFAFVNKHKAEKIYSVLKLSYKTFSNFVTGQCLEACILGCMFFVVLNIFRIPYSLLIGVLIAFTALIPIVGAFIGCFISAILILMVSPIQALIFIAIFLIIQQIEGNLIYPHVVGNSVGLPSIWVLVSVTLGGKLFGVIGMLLFIPLSSILYTLFKEMVNKRLKNNNIDITEYTN